MQSALRLSGGSGLALRLLSSKELVLTVDVGVGEARSDDGDTHLIAQGLVDNGTEDDVGLGVDGVGDNVGGVADLLDAQVLGTGDGKQHARGAIDGALEQRAGDGLLGSIDGTGVPRRGTDTHHGGTGLLHDGLNIGEVQVDDTGDGDEVGDALGAAYR